MTSPYAEKAIEDALQHGRALLKFISPNDAGLTGGHQCGFYLPREPWPMFTPQPPEKGVNHKHPVRILWQDGRVTDSVVTWYGQKTRFEYRLTRFGRDFPFLNHDAVGSLLVLVPVTIDEFHAWVLDFEEDIIDVQAALGTEVIGSWGVFEAGREEIEDEDKCVDRLLRECVAVLDAFPPTLAVSTEARQALIRCIQGLAAESLDTQLMRARKTEYRLFRLLERKLCDRDIYRVFQSVDDFLSTAQSILQRRKSRAGKSFEHQVGFLLDASGIPYEAQPRIDGKPDLVIPGVAAYQDAGYPVEKLFVVGLKTTCKDRWRQVLNEGTRVPTKHLITLQEGISANQLAEMARANVSLIVPRSLHRKYPEDRAMPLLSVDEFVATVRATLAS